MFRIISLLFIILYYSTTCSAQGLNVELGFNNQILQRASPVCNFNGETYFVRYEGVPGFSLPKHTLSKHDTLGNLLWQKEVEFDSVIINHPEFGGNVPRQTLKLLADSSGLYLLAYSPRDCDIVNPVTIFIDKFSHNGNKLWTYFRITQTNGINSNDLENAMGLSLNENGNLLIHHNYIGNNKIVSINSVDGIKNDSLNIEFNSLSAILQDSHSGYLVAEENNLMSIDSNGVVTQTFSFSQRITGLAYTGDYYIALLGDSMVTINEALTEFTYFHDPNYLEIQKIKIINNQVWLSARSADTTYILNFSLSGGFELIQSIPREIQLNNFDASSFEGVYDFDQHHITFVEPYQLVDLTSIRYLDYSLKAPEEFLRIDSDAGVVGIELTDVDITYSTNLIGIELDGKVCVKNFGENPINRVRINKFHYSNFITCTFEAFSQEFTNINILPNDTAWFYCDKLYRGSGFYSPSVDGNPINLNLCVYSSHPNNLVDLNVSNDEGCEFFVLGFHGINNISANNSNRKLVKITDILGRETTKQPGQLLLYIYDNGEVEKILQTWE